MTVGLGCVVSTLTLLLLPIAVQPSSSMSSSSISSSSSFSSSTHTAAALIQCDVCRHLVSHLASHVKSWRPLKVTEVAVHEKMEQVCHGQGQNSFVDSVLAKATIVKQNNGHAYALVARDDFVDANDDARVGKGLPDHFMESAVYEACERILGKEAHAFGKAMYRHAKKVQEAGGEMKLEGGGDQKLSHHPWMDEICEISCKQSKATQKRRKRSRKHGRRHGNLHQGHDEL
mmetsp:Transcript_19655/g.35056  ORF Transcript_19655/g.35056 Transcript_19655/m.35056 type:complete len:231 (-) Transcript_19655:128-820(-)